MTLTPVHTEGRSRTIRQHLGAARLRIVGPLAFILCCALTGCRVPGVDTQNPNYHYSTPPKTNVPSVKRTLALPLPETNIVKSPSRPATPPAPKTNWYLPAFKYPIGAATNWWSLQRKVGTNSWVTIADGFYGTNGGTTADIVETNSMAEYRMKGSVRP